VDAGTAGEVDIDVGATAMVGLELAVGMAIAMAPPTLFILLALAASSIGGATAGKRKSTGGVKWLA
jgi:hypothetical protein